MKQLFVILLLTISTASIAQQAQVNAMFAKYRAKPNTFAIALPGWLVRFGLSVSGEMEEMKDYKPLLRGLHHMKVLVMEDKNYASPEEIKRMVSHAKKVNFQDLLAVRSEGTRVNIMVREKETKRGGIIKNLLVVVSESDELILVSIKGRWKRNIINKMLKHNDIEMNLMDTIVGVN